jgi:hypothetical protein
MIKTYRGTLADGGQDKIRLKTNKGDLGYRIKKFQIIPNLTGAINAELVCKLFKNLQTTIDAEVNFTDGDLLGVAYYKIHQDSSTGSNEVGYPKAIMFDKVVFNQDIYVTAVDAHGSSITNYYLELEQIKLNDNESSMATLQSLRQVAES